MSADEIRAKRLQRLQQAGSSTPALSAASRPDNSDLKIRSEPNLNVDKPIDNDKTDQVESGKNVDTKVETKAEAKAETKASKKEKTIDEWHHDAVQQVFLVSLEPSSNGQTLVLDSVAKELAEEGVHQLSTNVLDRVLWSRFTEHTCLPSPFDYLWACWTRASNLRRTVARVGGPLAKEKTRILNVMCTMCQSYAVLTTATDMVQADLQSPQVNVGSRLMAKMSATAFGAANEPWEFMYATVEQAVADGLLAEYLTPVFDFLSTHMAAQGYSGDYKPALAAFEGLMGSKTCVDFMVSLERFSGQNLTPPELASATVLGPFLALSPLDGEGPVHNFPAADVMSPAQAARIGQDIQAEYHIIQGRLADMCKRIVRASPEARTALLRFFGTVLDRNHRRMAMQVQPGTVSPDGFMLNITVVLTRLSEPFADLYGSKLSKIDFSYFVHGPLFDIADETRIDADLDSARKYADSHKSETATEVNFITHAFFLACGFHHYGLGGLLQSHTRVKRAVDDARSQLDRLEAEAPRWRATSHQSRLDQALARLRNQVVVARAAQLSLESVLNDTTLARPLCAFALFQCLAMVRAVDPAGAYPNTQLSLPFTQPSPDYFRHYPEYLVETSVNYLLNLSRYNPQVVLDANTSPLLAFVVVFLRNSSYIHNPYIKSKFVELLFVGAIDMPIRGGGTRPGFLVPHFDSDRLCLENLMHLLMNFYIEIEQTGRSSQFYDKFNTRYYISQIIKAIWRNPVYRDRLAQESDKDVDFFVRFVALLLNDATYLLDESLNNLLEIHRLQDLLAENPVVDGEDDSAEPAENSPRDHARRLATAERQAKSYMQLTNETVMLFDLFTSAVPRAFVTSEIVDRLAAMVNYNLEALAGPKCNNLKVRNPDKYAFNPRALLSSLSKVYLNLSDHESFVRAVARDGRSYNPRNFERAASILSRWGLLTPEQTATLLAFRDRAEAVRLEDEQGDLELGDDIPDEFLDPVMYTLMEEPVVLPSSKVTIDLSTIKSHLLSDPKDPFNRAPLRIEDVVPNLDLKARIEQFKRDKRDEYRAKTQAAAAQTEAQDKMDDKMDLTE